MIEFNPYAYEVHEDPYPFYTHLRAEAPVYRDESVFERSDEYDLTRDCSRMLSFGQGTHFCLGASLARLEGAVSLEEWWKRFPDYRVETDGVGRVHSVNVRGFANLPVCF